MVKIIRRGNGKLAKKGTTCSYQLLVLAEPKSNSGGSMLPLYYSFTIKCLRGQPP